MKEITFTAVDLPWGWLGNMSAHPIRFDGKVHKTAEHLFQYMRFKDFPDVQELILERASPFMMKLILKKYKKLINDDKKRDSELMRKIVRLKVIQHADLIRQLVCSEGEIIENCTARQAGSGMWWGAARQEDGSWLGRNELGKIWMELRYQLKETLMV